MLQLDGIRGLATIGVLVWHWLQPYVLHYCHLGVISVRLFFVLSGFLITGILLKARRQREESGEPWWHPVRHFYIRRSLRIFPLYYLVLGLLLIVGVDTARRDAGWHLLYLTNILSAMPGGGDGVMGHFWSLAVEEQFYLVWPWLVLFMPRRAIPWAIGAMLVAGPVSRGVIHAMTGMNGAANNMTSSCFDSLGVGALLAWAKEHCRARPDQLKRLPGVCLAVGAPLLAVASTLYVRAPYGIGWVVMLDLGVALCAGWLIAGASVGFKGPLGWCLEFPPLLFMGTVSYCVYIVHPFVHTALAKVYPAFGMSVPGLEVQALVALVVTLGVSTASWHLFEKRLIRFGRQLTPEPARAGLAHR
jgi:peptidoglycan/LPS O-acetylase OafA/YrhL